MTKVTQLKTNAFWTTLTPVSLTMHLNNIAGTLSYLSKCAFGPSQKVVIRDLRCGVVHVIDSKAQLLDLLKVVIEFKGTRELWTQRVLDILSSTNLQVHVRNTTAEVY